MNNQEEKQATETVTEVEKTKKERDEYLAGWQRARADFLNYKKDETERLARTVQFANEDLIKDLIFVLDSFSLVETGLKNKDNLRPVLMIKAQLENALKNRGLEKIKVVSGEEFNPEKHEAVEMAEHSGSEGVHKILEVIADGYALNGKLIRPARVKVSK